VRGKAVDTYTCQVLAWKKTPAPSVVRPWSSHLIDQALEIFERLGTLIEPDKVRKELAELPA